MRYFRPLSTLSFVVDRALWGRSPLGFHLTSLLLHAATTLLVHAVALRLLVSGPAAWFAAALFALHPCHAEAVLWVSARADLLCALFYLAAFLCHLRGRIETRGRLAWWTASAALLALSLMAKEMAVTLPAVVMLEIALFPRGETLGRRLRGPFLAAAVVVFYLVWRSSVIGPLGLPPRPFALAPGDPGFASQGLVASLQYLADLVLFVPADPVVTRPFWQGHPFALALVATLAAATLLSLLRAVRGPQRGFALGFTALALLPVLPLTVGEHFLYLPSFGYCLLVGAKLAPSDVPASARSRAPLVALGVLIAAVALARTLAFGTLAHAARQSVDDALAAWDAMPRAAEVLVVDLPGPAALGFAHALRGERPGRPVQVEILTLSSQVLPGGAPTRSEITGEDSDRLAVRRDEPLLGSYIEQAFAGGRGAFAPDESVWRGRLFVTVRDVRDGRPLSLEVSRPGDPQPALLLRAEGYRLRGQSWPR